MSAAPLYSVEALGTHERLSFSCGVPELDHYLHVQAGQDAKRKVAAPFVLVDPSRNVVGYYTLSAMRFDRANYPPKQLASFRSIRSFRLRFWAASPSARRAKVKSWAESY